METFWTKYAMGHRSFLSILRLDKSIRISSTFTSNFQFNHEILVNFHREN